MHSWDDDVVVAAQKWYQRLPAVFTDDPLRMKVGFDDWCRSRGLSYHAQVYLLLVLIEELHPDDIIEAFDAVKGSARLRGKFPRAAAEVRRMPRLRADDFI